MAYAFPIFEGVTSYDHLNPAHRAVLSDYTIRCIERLWVRETFTTVVEGQAICDRFVSWFLTAGFDAYIPQADFEAAVQDAIRAQVAWLNGYDASLQTHFRVG